MRTPFYSKLLLTLFFAGLLLTESKDLFAQSQKIIINELVAKNELDIRDESGYHHDWVEFYNPGEAARDLGGMFLTDNEKEPQKWRIPDLTEETTIPAKGHVVCFLDGQPETGVLHGNFKLSRKGETLFLFDRDGKSLVDSVSFPELPADVSWSRIPDGGSVWAYVASTTANQPNPSIATDGVLAKPKFDLKSGWFDKSINVAISCEPDAKIYVTTDGSCPNELDSLLYTQPIEITKTTVLRARAFKQNSIPSEIGTRNFFIDATQHTIPVIAVTVDPEWLWERPKGILHERNTWCFTERPAHLAYYSVDREKVFSLNGGIKLQGSFSRNFAKKSFTITAGQRYGNKKIKGKIFTDIERDSFDGLVVRADCNYAGHDETERWWGGDRIRNELIYHVNKEMDSSVIMQAYQPAALYLNGEYWGLYNVTERKNKNFIEDHYPGVGAIDMLNPAVQWDDGYSFETYQGDGDAYRSIEEFIKASDMTSKSVYQRLSKWIDIPNFIDCWIYEIYTVKGDPTSNSRMWRPRTSDGKWQSIAFDWDHWREQEREWIHRYARKKRGKSWLFAMLIKNEEFQVAFINRLCDYLNTTLSAEHVERLVWEIHERVEIEKRRDRQRWEDKLEFMPWGEQIENTIEFAEERPEYLYAEMTKFFDLPGPAEVEVDVNQEGQGFIRFSTLEITQFPWYGQYMQEVPVEVEAVPLPGYRFVDWSDPEMLGLEATAVITLSEVNTIEACFEPDTN
ncbi:MAG: CotH kinase family protein [Pirellulaceae bacterium]|nr:CotH kinase family protein [Pirellulaceae bacterium]